MCLGNEPIGPVVIQICREEPIVHVHSGFKPAPLKISPELPKNGFEEVA